MDAAADGLVHRLLGLFGDLDITCEMADEQLAIPTFSKGWDTNMTIIFDTLHKIIVDSKLDRAKQPLLPVHVRSPSARNVISMVLYRWATRHDMAAYLDADVRKIGGITCQQFTDIVNGWGTDCQAGLGNRFTACIYQIIGLIARLPGIDTMINPSHFVNGSTLRQRIIPARQVSVISVDKAGKRTRTLVRKAINVLRFDNIRFLTPKERSVIKEENEATVLEELVQKFDRTPIKDRKYSEFESEAREMVNRKARHYFLVRRMARTRLYAIKDIRREAKLSDQIADTEFASNEIVETTIKLVEQLNIDANKKAGLIARLSVDMQGPLPPDSNESEGEGSVDTE